MRIRVISGHSAGWKKAIGVHGWRGWARIRNGRSIQSRRGEPAHLRRITEPMPIDYTIDREKTVIFETWTGEVRTDDLAAYWKRYLADPEVMEIRRTVVDLRTCVIGFNGSQIDFLIKTIVFPALQGRTWRTAIVVEKAVQFGISRQYQAFAELYSKDSIFTSMAEAEKWICSEPG